MSVNNFYNNHKGSIIVDIILAISLLIIFIVLISGLSIQSRQMFENSKNKDLLLNAFRLDEIFFNRFGDFDIGQSFFLSSSTFNLLADMVLYGNNLKENNIKIIDTSYQDISEDNSNRFIDFTSIYLLDSANNINLNSNPICSVDFSGHSILGRNDISNHNNILRLLTDKIKINQIALPIDPGLLLTDFQVRNGIAYLSADSNISSDPDLFIFNIRDINNPFLISSLNTGPGIVSISLVGKRIFAAASSGSYQLHTIYLNDLINPVLESRYRIPLPYATATPAFGSAISYQNGKIYLGTERWVGDELNLIDVSIPLSFSKIDGYEIDSKINQIVANDNRLYITASNHNQFIIFNIDNPYNLDLESTFSPSGWERQEGNDISIFEGKLVFGRTPGGFDLSSDHEIFNIYSTSSTVMINSSVNIPGGVYGIISDRSMLYVATRQINKEFQIFDNRLSTSTTFSLPIAPRALTCDFNSLYVLANRAPFIFKITFQ